MPGNNTRLLVVPGGVASKLQYLGGQVLHDSSQVDRGTSTHPLGVVALPEKSVHSAHRELETCPVRARLALDLGLATLSASRHVRLEDKSSLKKCYQAV